RSPSASLLARDLGAQARFTRLCFRRDVRSEVLVLEHLADLDFALLERRALQPLDGFFLRFHAPDPEAGDELLGLGERSVDDFRLALAKPNARALGARVQPLALEHHARLDQLFVELRHLSELARGRQLTRLAFGVSLYDDHEPHGRVSVSGFVVHSRTLVGRTSFHDLDIRRRVPRATSRPARARIEELLRTL